MEEQVGAAGCVLIDDVASELDEPNKRILLELLQGRLTQFFITATGREIIEEGVSDDTAVFQIAEGRITQAQNP
jgi:recombinational DNA repair ATPase RecF